MSEIGGSNLVFPLPFKPIRHAVKRHRPFPCSDPAFGSPDEFRQHFDPEKKTDGASTTADAAGDGKEDPILTKLQLMQMIEAEAQNAWGSRWASGEARAKAVSNENGHISKTMSRRHNKHKVLKKGRRSQQSPGLTAVKNSPSDNSFTPTNSCRYDSSLGLLTKKFINLIKHAKDGTIDLNRAAETLEVQKRRMYDITNVLEGIGLIEKHLKNKIRWKGLDASEPGNVSDESSRLKAEVSTLHAEELALDHKIRAVQESISAFWEAPDNRRLLFVSEDDIRKLPCFQNETLIAIKAPHGTILEVPDPDVRDNHPERHYEMLLRSTVVPIDVYLLSHAHDVNHVEQPHSGMDSSTREFHDRGMYKETGTSRNTERQGANQLVNRPQDRSSGIVKIVPFEDSNEATDYWLLSESGVSITDMWKPDANSDQSNTQHHPG